MSVTDIFFQFGVSSCRRLFCYRPHVYDVPDHAYMGVCGGSHSLSKISHLNKVPVRFYQYMYITSFSLDSWRAAKCTICRKVQSGHSKGEKDKRGGVFFRTNEDPVKAVASNITEVCRNSLRFGFFMITKDL